MAIDVKDLTQSMLGEGNNHGLMIQLKTEEYYRSLFFASSDFADAALHPRLTIEYKIGNITSTKEIATPSILVYPNPFSTSTTFDLGENAEYTISLYSTNGELVKKVVAEGSQIEVSREGLSTGFYFYQVTTATNFVDIKYEHAVYPIRIHIYETFNPGGVVGMYIIFLFYCSQE